jgi:hypothetical protein
MKLPATPKKFVLVGMSVILAGILSFLVTQDKALDLSKEEAPFPSIAMPPQAVYGSGYMDGGSVGVLIVDHSGAKHEITFPIDYDGIRNAHPTAFIGNMNDPKKVPLKNPERAKKLVIRLIDAYGKEWNDPDIDTNDQTARARRALASPPDAVAVRTYEKIRRTLGY